MLIISRKKIRKRVTLEDFMRLKKDEGVFEDMRQNAKTANFALLFGCTGKTFASKNLETDWTEETCDNYIKDNRLQDLKTKIIGQYPRETPKMWKLITCATDIRNKFFNTYKGLMERIEREKTFALQHGYVRSWNGACRRIPELFLMEKTDRGNVREDDRNLYGKLVGNLFNIAANTSIQNLEACIVMRAITFLVKWFKDENMKSFVWGSVHDSIDIAIFKPELEKVCLKIEEICRVPVDEYLGMPMDIDIIVANLKEGQFYKGGKPWRTFIDDSHAYVPAT